MKSLILVLSLALAACSGVPMSVTQAPAPLAATAIDDRALQTAWKSFDVALDAINLYLDAKPSVIGTPGAKRLADGIDALTAALTAAESAAAAGSTTSYAVALVNVKDAAASLRVAMLALKGK